MPIHRRNIGNYFEDKICKESCLVCDKSGYLWNLNHEQENYPHVDVKCNYCNSVFQVKASSIKYNLKQIKQNIYEVNMFRERIVNEAIDLYGDNYHIISIHYSINKKEKKIIERMVLSTRINGIIKRDGGLDAVQILGRDVTP
jgi:hypothetical protein